MHTHTRHADSTHAHARVNIRYSADFLAGLASLPLLPGKGAIPAYLKFIDTFGTHVPAQVTMGGVASMWSDFTQDSYDKLVTENVDLEEVCTPSLNMRPSLTVCSPPHACPLHF
jgi:hypothetical protein